MSTSARFGAPKLGCISLQALTDLDNKVIAIEACTESSWSMIICLSPRLSGDC